MGSRHLTYSLRTLVIVSAFLGCGVGWFAHEVRQASRRQQAVLQIRGVRGHATYDYQLQPAHDWLGERIRGALGEGFLADVERVSIHRARDLDLQALTALPHVVDLRLNSRRVTDEGMPNLRGLKKLERLDLWCSQVTDQGLEHLGGLASLSTLDLHGTQVTNAGLKHLRGLTSLRVLKVRNTHVTPTGVAALQRYLPNCEVLGASSQPRSLSP